MILGWSGWRRCDQIALVLAGFFLLVLISEWLMDSAFEPRTSHRPPRPEQSSTPALPAVRPMDLDYAVVSERPLFIDTRRPYVSPPPAAAAVAPIAPPEPMTLLATVLTEGRQVALVQSQRDNRIQKLGIGETVSGWVLAEVQSDFVTLRRGNETRRLDLVVKPGDPPAAAPAKTEE